MDFAQRTIDLARRNVEEGGRPFATVIVKDGKFSPKPQPGRPDQRPDRARGDPRDPPGLHHPRHRTSDGATIYILALPCPMCLGALYYCSPDEVVFLTTREAYAPHYVDDRKYFELNTFYDEFAKPWDQRRLPMRHESHADAVDVYRRWQERNNGERRVAGAPTAD